MVNTLLCTPLTLALPRMRGREVYQNPLSHPRERARVRGSCKTEHPRFQYTTAMLVLPITTGILKKNDDLAAVLTKNTDLQDRDIIVISSKAIATVQGAAIDLTAIQPTDQAKSWAERSGRSPEFSQAVLNETARLHGRITGGSPQAILTELKPRGFTGVLLVPNAGLDQSNIAEGEVIGWPADPVASVCALRQALEQGTGVRLGLVISDSNCTPRRWGVTAFALVCSGFNPLSSQIGKKDLFGRPLTITQEAVADQLATAANAVMGNADQATPAAIIRDHGIAFSDFEGWVPGIDPKEDLFQGMV